MRRAGIKRVTGRLYADDTIFDRLRGVADSGYATSAEIGPLSGLDFNSGFAGGSSSHFSSDPAKLAAAKLARALRRAGVRVPPQGRARRDARRTPKRWRSSAPRTLSRIVNITDVYSDNFFAEMLIKLLGADFGSGRDDRRRRRGGRATTPAAWAPASTPVDGSGLTRSNRASPAAGRRRCCSAMREPARSAKNSSRTSPLAGKKGTVAGRMQGTAAYGRCRAQDRHPRPASATSPATASTRAAGR